MRTSLAAVMLVQFRQDGESIHASVTAANGVE
jgi:hypothetical protein